MARHRIAAVQTHPTFGAVAENLTRAEQLIRSQTADLYVLPELFSTGYLFDDRAELAEYAEVFGEGPVADFLTRISRETGALIMGGFPERTRAGELFNSAAIYERGKACACYRKIHLFNNEKACFDAGDAPPRVVASAIARLGPMICFDWIFPETARCLALAGAQILIHATNLVLPYCQAATVTRCIENGVFAVTANRIGTEDRRAGRLTFTGGSQITDPRGEILAHASNDAEEVITAEIDPARADEKYVTDCNHLITDRRPGLYRALVD